MLQGHIWSDHPDAAGHVQLRELDDLALLRANLAAILSELQTTGRVPCIHIESHGSPDELVLASGELCTWGELKDLLTPINIASEMNLFVSLSACFGHHFAGALRPTDPAPLWGLLGPREEETSGFLIAFYRRVYGSLMLENNLREAVSAGGGGIPAEVKRMVLWPAEYFFVLLFSRYIREYGTNRAIAARAKWTAAKAQIEAGLPKEARKLIARAMRIDFRNQEGWCNHFRRTFLMLDRYPHNADRFDVDWARFQEVQASYGP